jgi:hypothetical protein
MSRYTHCTVIRPGCHNGPGSYGAIVSRHGSAAAAIKAARKSDRLVAMTLCDEGYPQEPIAGGAGPQRNHPHLGAGRFGRSW